MNPHQIRLTNTHTKSSGILKNVECQSVSWVWYSMATQLFKILTTGKPNYQYQRFFGILESCPGTQTRTLLNSESRVDFRLSQGRGTFFYLASNIWNSLPLQIRNSRTVQEFKRKSKTWVKFNLPAKV